MNLKGLIIAAVVFAALAGLLYWSNHHKPAEKVEASIELPPKIITLEQSDLVKVDIKKKGAPELVLARNSSGNWEITAPKPLRADQDAVARVVATLTPLTSERLVEDKASNLAQYGLTQPSMEVDITEKNNKSQKLLLGDDTPTYGGVYAALAGDPRVFATSSYNKSNLDRSADDLRDKRLLMLEPDRISRVELLANKQDIEFGRNKDEWQILKPKPLRADGSQVGELVRKLTDAKMDPNTSSADAKKAAAAFASGTPVAIAKVTDASGTDEFQVRKNKNDYYAKSSMVEGVYKVPADLGQALDKGLDDFRNKKLFDFGYSEPNKIELHDGPKAFSLTRNSTDWWSGDGKKLDMVSVQSLIGKVRDLSASKFVDSGFGSPSIEVTVTSSDGKRIEKLLISKNGDNYVARRENETALYALDPKSVEDLQKTAGELKPEALPEKSKK